MRIDASLRLDTQRPTRAGRRRHPRRRDSEITRPAQVLGRGLELSFANMVVIDRAREEGFGEPARV